MRENLQGTAEFLDVKSWKVIGRDHWTPLPTPNSIIDVINDKAKLEGVFEKSLEIDHYDKFIENDIVESEVGVTDVIDHEYSIVSPPASKEDIVVDDHETQNDIAPTSFDEISHLHESLVTNKPRYPRRERKSNKNYSDSAGFYVDFKTESKVFFTTMSIADATKS